MRKRTGRKTPKATKRKSTSRKKTTKRTTKRASTSKAAQWKAYQSLQKKVDQAFITLRAHVKKKANLSTLNKSKNEASDEDAN